MILLASSALFTDKAYWTASGKAGLICQRGFSLEFQALS
jgi:hypothetical protein